MAENEQAENEQVENEQVENEQAETNTTEPAEYEQRKQGRFEEWVIAHTGISIIFAAFFGLAAVYGAIAWINYHCLPCEYNNPGICALIAKSPPWTLLTALGTVFAVLLTWYIRSVHRHQELDKRERELIERRRENAHREKEFVTRCEEGKERLFNERYARAIELLGNDDIDVKLGAVYALDRLAGDSEKDRATIINYFMALARRIAPAEVHIEQDGETGERKNIKDRSTPLDGPTKVLLQVIINSIGKYFSDVAEEQRPKFQNIDLRGMRFIRMNLEGVRFTECLLDNAIFHFTNLDRGEFRHIDFGSSTISSSSLRKARVYYSIFKDGIWEYVEAGGCRFFDSEYENSWGPSVALTKAYFAFMTFRGMLFQIDLSQAYFDDVRFEECEYLPGEAKFPEGFDPEKAGITRLLE
ncbi:MAG: pentapeptide repeat-containing protein [Candidatus Lernaella stagnicola]|nr:pentapeptide repeat-containing protein [Candidatus Lernaella stagnicola]